MRISDWSSDVCSSDLKQYKMSDLADDVNSGKLANLTYIDNVGTTINELGGLSGDDHPVADIRNGQAFLNEVYDILRRGPQWEKTVQVINNDEWGGFYDHVPPPFAPFTEAEAVLGKTDRQGCRAPCVIIGPQAPRATLETTKIEPNSKK